MLFACVSPAKPMRTGRRPFAKSSAGSSRVVPKASDAGTSGVPSRIGVTRSGAPVSLPNTSSSGEASSTKASSSRSCIDRNTCTRVACVSLPRTMRPRSKLLKASSADMQAGRSTSRVSARGASAPWSIGAPSRPSASSAVTRTCTGARWRPSSSRSTRSPTVRLRRPTFSKHSAFAAGAWPDGVLNCPCVKGTVLARAIVAISHGSDSPKTGDRRACRTRPFSLDLCIARSFPLS